MSCNEQPLRIYQGEEKVFRITVRNADGVVVDLSDLDTDPGSDDILMTCAPAEGDDATFQKTLSDDGGIAIVTPHTGDNVGLADITIASEDTATATELFQRYDVVLLSSGSRFQLVQPSDFEIVPVVTSPV